MFQVRGCELEPEPCTAVLACYSEVQELEELGSWLGRLPD